MYNAAHWQLAPKVSITAMDILLPDMLNRTDWKEQLCLSRNAGLTRISDVPENGNVDLHVQKNEH